MTGTSVKDVSAVMQSIQPSGSFGAQSVKNGGFTEVFNRQTSREGMEEPKVAETADKPVKPKEAVKTEEAVSETNTAEKEPELQEPVKEVAEPDEKELEKAMEVLGIAAEQVISQLAQTFEISEDAVVQIMDEMGMEPMDVLEPDMVGKLMLEIGGAQDSMELITNEALYSDFQTVMTKLDDVLKDCATELNVEPEEISIRIQEFNRNLEESVQLVETVPQMEKQSVQNAEEIPAAMPEEIQKVTTEGNLMIEIVEETVVDEEQQVQRQDMQKPVLEENSLQEAETVVKPQGEANTSDMARDERQTDAEGNNKENLLLSHLRESRLQPQVNQTTQNAVNSFTTDMETQDIMRQIMDYMKVQIKPDVTNVEMQLHPASLGTLQVQVASKGGVLTAQFITQSETVKAALESQLIQLQESFSEQGVKVEAIEVTVQTHQFESNLEQGRGRNQEAPERRNRVRRLNLDGQLTAEELESLDAESQLTAQMMAANGNTVDYTA